MYCVRKIPFKLKLFASVQCGKEWWWLANHQWWCALEDNNRTTWQMYKIQIYLDQKQKEGKKYSNTHNLHGFRILRIFHTFLSLFLSNEIANKQLKMEKIIRWSISLFTSCYFQLFFLLLHIFPSISCIWFSSHRNLNHFIFWNLYKNYFGRVIMVTIKAILITLNRHENYFVKK